MISGLLTMKRKTCFPELGGGGQFYIGKRINTVGDEGTGICARTEISQDADNADEK